MVSIGNDARTNSRGGGHFFRESVEAAVSPSAPSNYDIPTSNRSTSRGEMNTQQQQYKIHNDQRSKSADRSSREVLPRGLENSLMPNSHSVKFKHIFTGYFTLMEIAIILIYSVACFVDIIVFDENNNDNNDNNNNNNKITVLAIDKFSLYSIIHVIVWVLVGIFDRMVQWQHQRIRRRGYLLFYLRLRNLRRIPYGIYSTGNASLVLILATRQHVEMPLENTVFRFNYIILILVGLEVLLTVPILLYYVMLTLKFNCQRPGPDAALNSNSRSVLPFSSPPPEIAFSRGDNETENVEELLDKQADMIRYLQFHNANLGRKIMELQTQLRH